MIKREVSEGMKVEISTEEIIRSKVFPERWEGDLTCWMSEKILRILRESNTYSISAFKCTLKSPMIVIDKWNGEREERKSI